MTFELLSQFSVTSKTSMAMCTAITPLWCVALKCCILNNKIRPDVYIKLREKKGV